jgi:SAM-dependent methyltransferase
MMDYSSIFEQRGHEYHLAMQLAPNARRLEFETLFQAQPVKENEVLFDIPSGGGYLASHISVPVTYKGYEFSQGFANENSIVQLLSMDQPWPIGQADRVVSLAGLHHHADPLEVMARLKTHVKPNGWLHIADVAAGSQVGEFLNGFVDLANPMGHKGIFLPVERSRYPNTWKISRLETCSCPWHFSSISEIKLFCKLMFGLNPNCDDNLIQALEKTIGIDHTKNGLVLNWELLYLDVKCE